MNPLASIKIGNEVNLFKNGVSLFVGEAAPVIPLVYRYYPFIGSIFIHYLSNRYCELLPYLLHIAEGAPGAGQNLEYIFRENCFRRFWRWFKEREDIENELNLDHFGYRDKNLEAARQAVYNILGITGLRTGQDPVSPHGGFEEAVDAWLNWGKQEGLTEG